MAQLWCTSLKSSYAGPFGFIIFDEDYRRRSYSYQQVADAAIALTSGLREEGIKPGDKVIICSENRPEWLAAFWECVIQKLVVALRDYSDCTPFGLTACAATRMRVFLSSLSINNEGYEPNDIYWT